MAVTNWFC